jgi:hypothetical protein
MVERGRRCHADRDRPARWLHGESVLAQVHQFEHTPARRLMIARFAYRIAAPPNRLDQFVSAGLGQLPAQLAGEDVDDLHLRLIDPTVQVTEKILLRQNSATTNSTNRVPS